MYTYACIYIYIHIYILAIHMRFECEVKEQQMALMWAPDAEVPKCHKVSGFMKHMRLVSHVSTRVLCHWNVKCSERLDAVLEQAKDPGDQIWNLGLGRKRVDPLTCRNLEPYLPHLSLDFSDVILPSFYTPKKIIRDPKKIRDNWRGIW